MINSVHQNHGIAPLNIPIRDFHIDEAIRPEVVEAVSAFIRQTRQRYNGFGNKLSGNNSVIQNGAGPDVRIERAAQLGGDSVDMGLGSIPAIAERIEGATTFEEVALRLSEQPTMGGNIPNMTATQVAYGRALSHLAEDHQLEVHIPKMRVLHPGGEETEYSQWLHAMEHGNEHWLDDVPLDGLEHRTSLHLPYVNRYRQPDTLMVSTMQTPADVIQGQLQKIRASLSGYDMVTPEDYPHVFKLSRPMLLPSSHFMPHINAQHLRQGIFINDQELSSIVYGDATTLQLEGVLDDNGALNETALSQVNALVKGHWNEVPATAFVKRLATIGRRAGGSLSVFADADGLVVSELGLMQDRGEQAICEMLDEPHISSIYHPHKTTTGRGDSGAAAMYFDYLDQTDMEELAAEFSQVQLSPEQLQVARILLSQMMTTIGSCLVHHSPHSNLGQLPPNKLSQVLKLAMEQTFAATEKLQPISHQPQGIETGLSARGAIWRV